MTAHFLTLIFLFQVFAGFGATITSAGSGSWNSASTWQGGVVPGINDIVIIQNNHDIYLSGNAFCASLTVNGGANENILTINTWSLAVTGQLKLNAGTASAAHRTVTIGSGNVTCGSILTTNPSNNNRVNRFDITSGSLTVSGNIAMGTTSTRNFISITGTGTVNLGGTMTGGDFIPGTQSYFNLNGTAAQTIPNVTGYSFYHVRISNIAGVSLLASITNTYVLGNFSIESGSLSLGNYSVTGNPGKTFSVAAGASLILNGTAVMPTGFTFSLDPLSRVAYNRTSTQSVTALALPGYGILELAGTSAKTAAGNLNLQSNLIINGTAVFNSSTYTITIGGDWTNNSSFTASSSTVIFSGTAVQNIGGIISSTFNNLSVNNAAGVRLSANQTINGTLTFTLGCISTISNVLSLSNAASVTGAGPERYVKGRLKKGISSATSSKLFEVGFNESYAPVTLNFTGTTNSSGSITASVAETDHPQIGSSDIDSLHSANCYWSVSNSGVTGFTVFSAKFEFPASALDPGTDPLQFIGGLYSGSAWTYPATGTLTTLSTQLTGLTGFGEFQLGQLYPNKYRSAATGAWSAASTWVVSRKGTIWVPAAAPPDFRDGTIEIMSPHTVTVLSTTLRDTVDEVTVISGATLIVNVNSSGYCLIFTNGPGTDLTVNGNFEYQDDVVQLINGATVAVGNGGVFRFNFSYGGTYRIVVPTAAWDPGSTLEFAATNQLAPLSGLSQSFGNVIWNYPSQTAAINLGGNLTTVNGNFSIVSTGTSELQLTNNTSLILTIGGNMVISGGTLNFSNGAATVKSINLWGHYTQTGGTFSNGNTNVLEFGFLGNGKNFQRPGGTLTVTNINWKVAAGASLALLSDLAVTSPRSCIISGTLDCGISTAVTGTGSFSLAGDATLIIGSPDGITASGTAGNIRTSARTFSQDGSYRYNGTSVQNTGNGLPSYLKNLTISNPAGVTMNSGTTVKNTLALEAGILTIGNNLLGFHTGDIPVSRYQGSLSVSGSSSLKFGEAGFTGGAAFTLPEGLFATTPVIGNLEINRTQPISLNSQMMSVTGVVTANGPLVTNGKLKLLSTASQTALIISDASGSVTGNVTVQRYIPSAYGYRYLSTPLSGTVAGDFSPWIDLGAAFPAFYYYNENQPYTGWISYTGSSSPLVPMTGYAANFGVAGGSVTMEFTGTVNNGNYTNTYSNHNQPYTLGFNLAGNPYPSPVNWDALSGWTKTNIDNAIYYFNNGTTDPYGGTYSSYINGVSSDGIAGPVIPAFQGFFVHVSNGTFPVTGTLAMTNAVRVNGLNPVYHKESEDIPMVRIRGHMGGDSSKCDYAVVVPVAAETDHFDPLNDALKLMNTDPAVISIYTMKANEKLSIGTFRMPADDHVEIPLGVKVSRSGTVTVELASAKNIDDIYVYLYDRMLRLYVDLKLNSDASMYADEGEDQSRYSLILSKNEMKPEDPFGSDLHAWVSGGSLFLFTESSEAGNTVEIFDLRGRKVWESCFSGDRAEFRPGLTQGIYIVRCNNTRSTHVQKIYFDR